MTKAKAATVASALITAGYHASADELADGSWIVVARASAPLNIDTIKTFQDAQNIVASAAKVVFS